MAKPKKRNRKAHELVAFLAMWAVDYQKNYQLDGLHPKHYDLMKKYGARMDDFKRATLTKGRPPVSPFELIVEYVTAYYEANQKPSPDVSHAGGWYTIKSAGLPARKYRRREIEAMLGRLRERAPITSARGE